MTVIKCKMCGGDLILIEGRSVAECEYCGSRQTVPIADSEKKIIQFERAERLRRGCEFDKAAGLYEAIVSEFRYESEAYWGLVLCKYGIEYVDDPTTGKKIPTCHRSSFNSIMEDPDFENAVEHADSVARRIYRAEAKQIEEIRKNIISVSSSEQPYDIFICYKETDENGNRTLDSVLAQDIYDALTEKGYRIFFARITLEDRLGQEYEPYIFAALNSAKIMLVVGTDYEFYNAVWVKNEWSRYLKLMADDKSKHLIPCYKGIDAYDIPKEFIKLQAQDFNKVGAMQDLLRGIEKILIPQNKKTHNNSETNITAMAISNAYEYLSNEEWSLAKTCLNTVVSYEPDNARAIIGLLMVDMKCSQEHQLGDLHIILETTALYQDAWNYSDLEMQTRLDSYNKNTIYNYASDLSKEDGVIEIESAIQYYARITSWKDSEEQIESLKQRLHNAKEKRKKKQLAALQMALCAFVSVLIIAVLMVKHSNNVKIDYYTKGIELLEAGEKNMIQGEYYGASAEFGTAMKMFEKADSYKDAEEKYEHARIRKIVALREAQGK